MLSLNKPDPKKRRFSAGLAVAGLLAAAALLRVIFLFQIQSSELGSMLSLDSAFYHDLAKKMAAGIPPPPGALTFNPLYPLFLTLVFSLFGDGFLAPRISQLLLGLLTIGVMCGAAFRIVDGPRKDRLSGGAIAVVSGAMAILYGQFVLYEGMLLATALEIVILTASFSLALALDHDLGGERPLQIRGRPLPAGISGLLLGLLVGAGVLGRPNSSSSSCGPSGLARTRSPPAARSDSGGRPPPRRRDLPRSSDRVQRDDDRPLRARDRARGGQLLCRKLARKQRRLSATEQFPRGHARHARGREGSSRAGNEAKPSQAEVSDYFFTKHWRTYRATLAHGSGRPVVPLFFNGAEIPTS
jgi:hypothetical protein